MDLENVHVEFYIIINTDAVGELSKECLKWSERRCWRINRIYMQNMLAFILSGKFMNRKC